MEINKFDDAYAETICFSQYFPDTSQWFGRLGWLNKSLSRYFLIMSLSYVTWMINVFSERVTNDETTL